MKHCNQSVRDSLTPLPASLTVCATVDEFGREQTITDGMIRQACELMDADQLWPVSDKGFHRIISRPAPSQRAVILPFKPKR